MKLYVKDDIGNLNKISMDLSSLKKYVGDGTALFDKDGNKTSDYSINKDGSSKGFIQKEDGSIQQWDEKAGSRNYNDQIF